MNDKDVLGSDVIADFDADLAVCESPDLDLTKIDFQYFSYLFSKCLVGITGEDDHVFSELWETST